MIMTPHDVLVAARNLIDRYGWVQYAMRSENGGYCTLGALTDVVDDADREGIAVALEAKRIFAKVNELHLLSLWPVGDDGRIPTSDFRRSIPHWNDWPGRTEAEVLAAFDKAIAATAPEPSLDLSLPERELVPA